MFPGLDAVNLQGCNFSGVSAAVICVIVLIKNLLLLGLFTRLGGRILDLDQTSDRILQSGALRKKKN